MIRQPAVIGVPLTISARAAAEAGPAAASVLVDEPWRAALTGLGAHEHILLFYWMGAARRDLTLQQPRHRNEPVGTFALRSPARPNPIAVAAVRLLEIDQTSGRLAIDAIDCIDGTPLLDIKPWMASIDIAGN